MNKELSICLLSCSFCWASLFYYPLSVGASAAMAVASFATAIVLIFEKLND